MELTAGEDRDEVRLPCPFSIICLPLPQTSPQGKRKHDRQLNSKHQGKKGSRGHHMSAPHERTEALNDCHGHKPAAIMTAGQRYI